MRVRQFVGPAHYNGYGIRTNNTPDTIPAPQENLVAVTVERTVHEPRYVQYHLQGERLAGYSLDALSRGRANVSRATQKGKQWFLQMNPKTRSRQNSIPIDLII